MVKTLRITGFLTVLSAIAIIALIINSGVQTNPNIEDFLKGPQVVEIFKSSIGSRPVTSTNQEHPLVLQAQAFAKILAPPVKKVEIKQPTRTPSEIINKGVTKNKPKFDVISTIYYAQNPDASLALIREGKQTRWISQGSTVSHLLISEIQDGLVIVKNDEETFELKTPEKNFNAPVPASSSERTRITNPVPAVNRTPRVTSAPVRTPRTKPVTTPKTIVAPKTIVTPRTMEEDEKLERLEEVYEKLKMISDSRGLNPDGSEISAEENAIRMQEIVTEFKKANTNVDSEEAQRLIDLGAYLEHVQDRDESN